MANEYLNNRTFEAVIQYFQYYKRQKAKYLLIIEDYQQTHERRQLRYKDDTKLSLLEEAKTKQKTASVDFSEHQDQLACAFYILAENIANYAKFNGIDVDDAIQEGVLICLDKIDRFDPRKGKAFNYMTTCILNHYRQLYRSARNYNELKKRYHNFLQERIENIFVRNGKDRTNVKSGIDRDPIIW